MTRQRTFGTIFATAAGLLALAGPSVVAEPAAGTAATDRSAAAESQSPSELAREGVAKMLEAFNKLVESVPQYEMPELNENGDIILRRKRPEPAPVQPPAKTPEPAAARAI